MERRPLEFIDENGGGSRGVARKALESTRKNSKKATAQILKPCGFRPRGAAHRVRLLLHFPSALLSGRAWPVG